MADDPVTFLDKIMRERKLSNVDLARICGVSSQAARHWRLGVFSPKPSYARLIAAHFGVPKHLIRPDIWDPPPPAPLPQPLSRKTSRRTSRAPPPTGALSDEREEDCAEALSLPLAVNA